MRHPPERAHILPGEQLHDQHVLVGVLAEQVVPRHARQALEVLDHLVFPLIPMYIAAERSTIDAGKREEGKLLTFCVQCHHATTSGGEERKRQREKKSARATALVMAFGPSPRPTTLSQGWPMGIHGRAFWKKTKRPADKKNAACGRHWFIYTSYPKRLAGAFFTR